MKTLRITRTNHTYEKFTIQVPDDFETDDVEEETVNAMIDALIEKGLLTPDKEDGFSDNGSLDIDEVEEEREPTEEERVATAQEAMKRMEESWLQNEFGSEATDIIFDALNEYIEKRPGKNK